MGYGNVSRISINWSQIDNNISKRREKIRMEPRGVGVLFWRFNRWVGRVRR